MATPTNGGRTLLALLLRCRTALKAQQREIRASHRDNLELARRNRRLEAALRKELDLSFASPAFKDGLGGRTAVGTYRNENLGQIMEHFHEAGRFALAGLEKEAIFFLGTAVKADVQTIWAARAASREEVERRIRLRQLLSDEAYLRALAQPDEIGEKTRGRFIGMLLDAGVDTSVQELVRRSPEMEHGRPVRRDDEGDASAP